MSDATRDRGPTPDDDPRPSTDRATLASTFQLTRGQIDDTVTTARALASHGGVGTGRQNADSGGGHAHAERGLWRAVVVEACTTQSADGLDDLAAEVIATDVGMDLYKIDLSSVVSKYIGETEENLERIFDAAADSTVGHKPSNPGVDSETRWNPE